MNEQTKFLRIYLQDHDAAAKAGHGLADRCAAANAENALGNYLSRQFIPEVESDQQTVLDVLDQIGAKPSTVKRVALKAGQIVGQIKLNGRRSGYSPLSRVLELEGLIAGVHAKHRLWTSIEAIRNNSPESALPDVSTNLATAEGQLNQLQRHHDDAVLAAFTSSEYPSEKESRK